jgi:hypothetical protein
MAQQKVVTPTKTRFLCFFEKLRSQGPKKMLNTILLPNPKGETHYPPHKLGHGAIKKQMSDRLGHITETTLSTSFPLSFHQIIFG